MKLIKTTFSILPSEYQEGNHWGMKDRFINSDTQRSCYTTDSLLVVFFQTCVSLSVVFSSRIIVFLRRIYYYLTVASQKRRRKLIYNHRRQWVHTAGIIRTSLLMCREPDLEHLSIASPIQKDSPPWAWSWLRSLPVKREFFLPAVTKCLLWLCWFWVFVVVV